MELPIWVRLTFIKTLSFVNTIYGVQIISLKVTLVKIIFTPQIVSSTALSSKEEEEGNMDHRIHETKHEVRHKKHCELSFADWQHILFIFQNHRFLLLLICSRDYKKSLFQEAIEVNTINTFCMFPIPIKAKACIITS